MATANRPSTTYLQREESFMYDRENRFRMEDTMNAGRLEYTENGMTHMAARRCDVIRISLSGAIVAFITKVDLPKQFYFDIPDARISKVGAILMKTFANNTAEIRFLRLLTQKELDRIFVFSTHPAHKDRVLDVRSW
ncbi:hypothetical protein J5J10_14865 [Ciceribacter sp. L1K23]|uniref:hypothetical protein n=1 Tax=unclassified Ciceribacter TaxID=2628820 RepID=UPI001ABEB280|nr:MULTISPECIES: hypothetical protein [unclassified Ciceribacter]MBO3758331.1 hypothetical protein [Ciceribacter sp. L1K22]MBR0556967.1 hypothetical protein [Ciceribacter sp. L1K23]